MDNNQDFYHPSITPCFRVPKRLPQTYAGDEHAERRAGHTGKPAAPGDYSLTIPGVVVLSEYGHQSSTTYLPDDWEERPIYNWRKDPEVRSRYGTLGSKLSVAHCNIFPNVWFKVNSQIAVVHQPKGPTSTELWYFIFVDKNAPRRSTGLEAEHDVLPRPVRLLEQDDGENWDLSTRGSITHGMRQYDLNYSMAAGHGEIIRDETAPFSASKRST